MGQKPNQDADIIRFNSFSQKKSGSLELSDLEILSKSVMKLAANLGKDRKETESCQVASLEELKTGHNLKIQGKEHSESGQVFSFSKKAPLGDI